MPKFETLLIQSFPARWRKLSMREVRRGETTEAALNGANRLTRLLSLGLLLIALLAWGAIKVAASEPVSSGATNKSRPNVIVLVSDDLGYGDLGFQGGRDLKTPHLDALAKSGVRFTNAYVTGPVCGPTRAGLVSGRYQQRHSYDSNPRPPLLHQ